MQIATSPGRQHPVRPRVECVCTGEPKEMGLAQGQGLCRKITGQWQSLRELEAFRLEQPWWLPYPLFRKLAERKTAKALVPALERSDADILARMKGISQGSGVPLESLCLMNAMEAYLCSVQGRTTPASPGACSAVAVRRARARGGEPMIARNFDYIPLVQPFFALRESRPQRGWRSLDFLVAPQAGTIDGVNEKGLCITLNYAFMRDAGQPAPLVTMLIADALANCASVAEATERIAHRPRWGAGMLMLADASGDLASLELSNTRTGLRRPPSGQDWLAFTNVCCCPETCAVQVAETDMFSDRVPKPLRGRPVLQWHADRAKRIEELVWKHGTLGPEELAAIMADHGSSGSPSGSSPCVHTNYWRTTACLQWFPARRSVRVSFTTACTADYVELGL